MPATATRSRRPVLPSTRVHARGKHAQLTPFLSRVDLAAAETGQPRRSWAQLARTGDFYDPRYGDFSIARKDLASMLENFKSGKYPVNPTELAFDYNHGTGRPVSEEQGKASGWLKDLELRADGDELWGHVEWTETAAAAIESKEYRFVSATFSFEYTNSNGGEEIGPTLLAAALTNRPVIHGMEPLALAQIGARQLHLAADDETAEALFSFDEQRRRVQDALTDKYGVVSSYPEYYNAYRGVYLEALYDGYAVFCNYESDKFRIDYTIGADGVVTFTSDPVEVRVSYEPLAAALTAADIVSIRVVQAQEQDMSTMKIKDVKGTEIELAQDAIDAIVKAHAPKPAAEPVELAALKSTVETQGATILSLQKSNEALELSARQRDAEAEFDTLLKAGKVDPKQKETLVKLALANNEMFKELTATLPVLRTIGTETGSASDTTQATSNAAVGLAVAEEQKANPKLTKEQAFALALDKNPKLYQG